MTADEVRARFAGTSLPDDPLDVVMPPGLKRWPHAMRERLTGTLTPAGVLVPVMERPDGLSVLLTQRAADLKHHAGQVSFPGGRMEAHEALARSRIPGGQKPHALRSLFTTGDLNEVRQL